MYRKQACRASLIVVACLVLTGSATAGGIVELQPMDGPAVNKCKQIKVNVGPSLFLGSCEFEGTHYEFCLDLPMTGTLNGTLHYFGPPNNWVDVPAPMPGHPGISAGWALDVIETDDGELRATEGWIWHWDAVVFQGKGVVSTTASIAGGDGEFEGTTGWYGYVGNDVDGGVIRGEICRSADD